MGDESLTIVTSKRVHLPVRAPSPGVFTPYLGLPMSQQLLHSFICIPGYLYAS